MGVPHTGPGIRSRVCEEAAKFEVIVPNDIGEVGQEEILM
jgi:hypothetical protein